jgi:hypothetical protein
VTDLDLDSQEAIAGAPYLLPRTAVFGRASKRASHWIYKTRLFETQDRAAIKFMSSDKLGLLEVRIGGGGYAAQTVFPPSTHVSGESIAWEEDNKILEIDGTELLRAASRLAAAAQLARAYPNVGGRHDGAFVLGGFLTGCDFTTAQIAVFAEAVGVAGGQPGDKRRDMIRTAWDGAASAKPAGFPLLAETFGKEVAKKCADWLGYKGAEVGPRDESPKRYSTGAAGFSEDSIALEFADKHGLELRYVAPWGKWLAWTGTHWLTEKTLAVFDMARKICRDAASQSNKASTSHALTKAKTVSAVEMLARSDRRIAATIEQWDGDEFGLDHRNKENELVHRS